MSSAYDQNIFKSQAETIDQLRDELRRRDQVEFKLTDEIFRLKQIESFWLKMQKAVLEEPALHDQWKKLIAMLRLYLPDDVPGITSPLEITSMHVQETY